MTACARDALRLLAQDRLPPTPDNFRVYFRRIAGQPDDEGSDPWRALRQGAEGLPRHTPALLHIARNFEQAARDAQPGAVLRVLGEIGAALGHSPGAQLWGKLLRRLRPALAEGLDDEALTRLDAALASADDGHLFDCLQALADSGAWQADGETRALSPQTEVWRQLLGELFDQGLPALLLDDASDLADEAHALARELSSCASGPMPDAGWLERAAGLLSRIDAAGEVQHSIRVSLVSLLRLVVDNIGELVLDDRWLRGQLEVFRELFAHPLDIRTLDEVERRLKDVIGKQGALKRQLLEAEGRLKEMLAGFVDRLANFSDATGDYQLVLEHCAEQIAAASSLEELSDVVARVLDETRTQQATAERSHQELLTLRSLVDDANQRIVVLQHELAETSAQVRHDPLTGLLNRKGLDEAIAREIGRARRAGQPLCLGLIDVDDFKHINDSHGHQVGDQALRHLSRVIEDNLRAQDAVGRYGGEEFLLILPDTREDQAAALVTRLQRELTRHYFMTDRQRLLITFSAGVTLLRDEETPESAIARADQAMYLAKRAGKNRVFGL